MHNFSIDMVSSIKFNRDQFWLSDREIPGGKFSFENEWVVVAKGMDNNCSENEISWKCSYAKLEQIYLKDLKSCKPIIRFFKVNCKFNISVQN